MTRWSSAAALGAALTLAACGGGNRNQTASTTGDTTTAAGEVASGGATAGASGGATAGAAGAMGDSAAMAGSGGAAASNLGSLSEPDIMAMIGTSNAGEIATSEVAVDKATNASVKAFARKMVADHRAMQKEADQLATKLNVTPGTPQQAADKKNMANQMTQQLSSASKGEAFDRQYIDGQVQAHQQTLTELQAMQNTANADVKALITKAIPKVQAHLDEATKIQGQLSNAGGNGGNGGNAGSSGAAPSGSTGGATGSAKPSGS